MIAWLCLLVWTGASPPVLHSNAQQAPNAVAVEEVCGGLNAPLGVAVDPDSQLVYVAESGSGRVVRIEGNSPVPVINDFQTADGAPEGSDPLGPSALGFASQRLVVSSAGGEHGNLRVFSLPAPGQSAIAAASGETVQRRMPDGASQGRRFTSLAFLRPSGHLAAAGENQAWLIPPAGLWSAIPPADVEPAPIRVTALTFSPDGFLVAGWSTDPANLDGNGSHLTFYNPQDPIARANFPLGLRDVVALAYGPRGGRLFALTASRTKTQEAGLFKLVARENNTRCEAIKIVSLDRPTAMAFTAEGDLLITTLGDADPNGADAAGKLLKISALDLPDSLATSPGKPDGR